MTLRVRILCRVVDHFGDAGVCWRLARQLAREHGWRVRLTIDRPDLLARLGARTDALARGAAPVVVEPWPRAPGARPAGPKAAPAAPEPREHAHDGPPDGDDVVVSAFHAALPDALRASLAGAPRRPLWVQLEYLSAEDWVASCHGLRSTKPLDGAVEHFYYPGFDERTGGLLRERELFARRDAFVGSPCQRDWLAALGLDVEPGERVATLFCYPHAPVVEWLERLANATTRWLVLVPEGVAERALAESFGAAAQAPGRALRKGSLRVQRVPFLPQDDYDRLLWSADLNFVRGEDSWIRAQWAARPFLWQPYRQDDGAHLVKLRAFLARMRAPGAVDAAMLAWAGAGDWTTAWPAFEARLDALGAPYRAWSAQLGRQSDLCTRFVEFCAARL